MKKSKKALLAALACSAVLAGAAGLAACTPGDSGSDTHDHVWGSWTVETTPDGTNQGKATRTCTGKGTCDAATNLKEATLPVLSPESTDYTKSNDTATCQAAGTATYTYNKNGVNVSFTAASPVNLNNHVDGCEHNQPAAHSHVWGEWEIVEDPNSDVHAGYAGTATRECTGAGTCDADESLTTITIPSVLYGDEYEYDPPVHKTTATCIVEGVDTYTYKDAANNISISFDVKLGYGEHVFENNECKVCHKTITVLALDTEVTVNATDEESLYSFTAETAGKYEIIYTEGSGASVVINENIITSLPYVASLDAGAKVSLAMSAPNGVESATYKIKVIPVTILKHDKGTEENPVDPTKVPATATVNVGGGKTARVDASGSGYGIISYTGSTPIVVAYDEYVWGKGNVHHEHTLGGTSDSEESDIVEYCVVAFGYPSGLVNLTVSSAAGEAFNAELSLLLSETNPDTEYVITLDEVKNFEDIDMEGKVYSIEIAEAGDYTITFSGVTASEVYLQGGTNPESLELLTPDEDGKVTLPAGTYYISIGSDKEDPENMGDYLPISGSVIVSKVEAPLTLGQPYTVDLGTDYKKTLTIELEAGEYKILIDGEAMEFNLASAIMIGGEYEEFMGSYELVPLDTKSGSNDKIAVVNTAGTYYLEVYEDVTFTLVKVEAEV